MSDSCPATNHRRRGEPGVGQEFPPVLSCFLHEMFLQQRIVNGAMVLVSTSLPSDRVAGFILANGDPESKAFQFAARRTARADFAVFRVIVHAAEPGIFDVYLPAVQPVRLLRDHVGLRERSLRPCDDSLL